MARTTNQRHAHSLVLPSLRGASNGDGGKLQHKSCNDLPSTPPPSRPLWATLWRDANPTAEPAPSAPKTGHSWTAPTSGHDNGRQDEPRADAGGQRNPSDDPTVYSGPPPPPDSPLGGQSWSPGSTSVSAVSLSEWTAWQQKREFPPSLPWQEVPSMPPGLNLGALAQIAGPAGHVPPVNPMYGFTSSSAEPPNERANGPDPIPAMLSGVYDQRAKIVQYRKSQGEMWSRMKETQHQKTAADNTLHTLALSYSKSAKTLPQKKIVKLVNKIERLQSDYGSLELRFEELGVELRRREATLVRCEADLLQKLSTSEALVSGGLLDHRSSPTERRSRHGTSQIAQKNNNTPPTQQDARPRMASISHSRDDRDDRRDDSGEYSRNGSGNANGNASGNKDSGEGATAKAQSLSTTDIALLGISGEAPRDVHPLYSLLLRTIGKLNMAKEEWLELVAERDEIIAGLQTRVSLDQYRNGETADLQSINETLSKDYRSEAFQTKFSPYLTKGNMDFIRRFRDMENETKAEIRLRLGQVARVRAECDRRRVYPSSMSLEEKMAVFSRKRERDEHWAGGIIDIAASSADHAAAQHAWGPGVVAHWRFPTLLSNPQHLLAKRPMTARTALEMTLKLPDNYPGKKALVDDCVKEHGILTVLERAAPENKSDFINRWLLQKLRMSPLEAVQLFSFFSDTLHVMNLKRWQEDVLYCWARDGANVPADRFRGPVTSFVSTVSSNSLSALEDYPA